MCRNPTYPDTVVGVFRHDLSKGSSQAGLLADGATLEGLGADPSSCAQSIRAKRVILHPDYDQGTVITGSDVALIELMDPIACVPDVVTEYIELDNGDYSLPKMAATGSGWGRRLEPEESAGSDLFWDLVLQSHLHDQPDFADVDGVRNVDYPYGPNGVPHNPKKLRYYHTNITHVVLRVLDWLSKRGGFVGTLAGN